MSSLRANPRANPRPSRNQNPTSSFSWVSSFFSKNKGKQRQSVRKSRSKWNRSYYKQMLTLGIFGLAILLGAGSIWLGYMQTALVYLSEKTINFSAHIGLRIDEVYVEGRQHSPQDIILAAVQAQRGQPILAYNLEAIKSNLEKIDWIKSATVQRRLPNLLYIQMIERKPIALWHHQQSFFLVDQEGVVIASPGVNQFQHLPVVVGADAPVHAPKILALLEKFPEIRKKLSSLVRIRQRRWDLSLENSILVKLPEDAVEDALARLSLLIEQNKISKGETSIVDLRVPKQVILRLSKAAAVRLKIKGKET